MQINKTRTTPRSCLLKVEIVLIEFKVFNNLARVCAIQPRRVVQYRVEQTPSPRPSRNRFVGTYSRITTILFILNSIRRLFPCSGYAILGTAGRRTHYARARTLEPLSFTSLYVRIRRRGSATDRGIFTDANEHQHEIHWRSTG